jgi:predicted DNA-binding transcriptional regulator YafY
LLTGARRKSLYARMVPLGTVVALLDLIQLLSPCVPSAVGFLAEDIHVDPRTALRYLHILIDLGIAARQGEGYILCVGAKLPFPWYRWLQTTQLCEGEEAG